MKNGIVLVTAMMLLGMAGTAFALETDYGELGIDLDATWVSKYLFRGIDKLDDKAAFQPSINFDLFGSGFSAYVWSSFAGASKHGGSTSTVDAEEWRYAITYADSLFYGETYATNYAVSYVYYDYPDAATWDKDMQEINLTLALPDICPFGVVPSYTGIYTWPSKGGHGNRADGGFIHVFGLGYDMTVPGFLQDNPEQVLSFRAAAVYNDGTYGAGVDHDWSHIVWGVTTSIDFGPGTLTPGLYYQTSMDDSVNTEDEFWTGISYGLSF